MKEELLHYIWKFQLLNSLELTTSAGDVIQVIKTGEKNTNAGPDFFSGQIKIGRTIWAGNIEIHINSSDWNKHKHHNDPAYDNVILHVVYNHDTEVFTSKNRQIQVLELANLVDKTVFEKYQALISKQRQIPCQQFLPSIDDFTLKNWQGRLVVERLESKTNEILNSLQETGNDWEETFFRLLAKNFGFKVNALPFEQVAKALPYKYLKKHNDNLFQLEALLLGQAGYLEANLVDDYAMSLQTEYCFLKTKFNLKPIENHLWKMFRLRPSNFPTIRLVQFAKLIHGSSYLFSNCVESSSLREVRKLLDVHLSGYWENHFQLDKPSVTSSKTLGESSVNILIINTIVPLMFQFGKRKNKPERMEKALEFLHEIKAEKNSIISNWESNGIKVESSFVSQAMIHLKNEYCDKVRCLDCVLGNKILKD